jgi:hypothetical protein
MVISTIIKFLDIIIVLRRIRVWMAKYVLSMKYFSPCDSLQRH